MRSTKGNQRGKRNKLNDLFTNIFLPNTSRLFVVTRSCSQDLLGLNIAASHGTRLVRLWPGDPGSRHGCLETRHKQNGGQRDRF